MSPFQLNLTKLYDATPEQLFAAWTDPEFMKLWMCPEGATVPFVAIEPRVGGVIRVDMANGGVIVSHSGVIQQYEPPTLLAFSWLSPHTYHQKTMVTVRFTANGRQTELQLTQCEFSAEELVSPHQQGWQGMLQKLADYLQQRKK
jgi:uncharacterized protein YndB with AHSA1/START domain